MKAPQVYRIVVSTAWWFSWCYLPGVMTLQLLGFQPDLEKVRAVATSAIRLRLVRVVVERAL